MRKLEWPDIDLDGKSITIRPEISKTNRRRFIDLSENAVDWLKAYRQRGGKTHGRIVRYTYGEFRKHRRKNWESAGITEWIQQGMRHTYCSNWLAKHEDVNKLVLQSGHDSVEIMWRNYHKGIPKAMAEKFWAIRPPKRKGSRKIIPFAA